MSFPLSRLGFQPTSPMVMGYGQPQSFRPYASSTGSYPVSQKPVWSAGATQSVQWPYPVGQLWQNRLKSMMHNREAIIYALNIRNFSPEDRNEDTKIDPTQAEQGTFLKAIKRLPELKALGINTLHLLPILPVGKMDRLGEIKPLPSNPAKLLAPPGSVYAPAAYDALNPEFDEPNNMSNVVEEAREFIKEAHKIGIHVMVDVPSAASTDLAKQRPDLMAKDSAGNLLTPTNWVDIRMFVKDSPALREYYQRFFDLMNSIGVDGYRVDVARARTPEFWQHFIQKMPEKAWLAESYTEEDASPMLNIPRDIPEILLRSGFDSYYGQYHIFHNMNANEYIKYIKDNEDLFGRVGQYRSAIGSFQTHDDQSTMMQGGTLYNLLISGLMMTQPGTNPYILDGFTTGATYDESHENKLPIFDYTMKPQGIHPEIGDFTKRMIEIRNSDEYKNVLTRGRFVPLAVQQDAYDPKVVTFIRQYGNKTVLIMANKDVNASHKASIMIPGLTQQTPKLVSPTYGEKSQIMFDYGKVDVNLARGRFYMFDISIAPDASTNASSGKVYAA
jgi:glycosidase